MAARQNLTVRMTRLEQAEIRAAAKQAGVSTSEYIRQALAKARDARATDGAEAARWRADYQAAVSVLKTTGGNLEQVLGELQGFASALRAARAAG